jgi:hypothetical protein
LTWDRCYDFKNIFAKKKSAKKCRFWLKTKLNYAKLWSLHWFSRKRQFFRRKLAKNTENCDHNIDPCNYWSNDDYFAPALKSSYISSTDKAFRFSS